MPRSRSDLAAAIGHYHELIAVDPQAAEAQVAELTERQRRENVLFGGRVMAASLRPALLTEGIYRSVQRAAALLRQALDELSPRILAEPAVQEELGLSEFEREIAAIPTRVLQLSATTRLDSFMTAASFSFVEVNAESPAGLAYCHHLASIYRALPVFQRFAARYPVRYVSPLEHLLAGLLRVYHEEFDGEQERPSFAIVDFLNIPTYPEFLLIKGYLERLGYPCEIADPRTLECDRQGFVVANGRRIDILYRRLLVNELVPILGEAGAFMAGYRAGKTCYINTLRSKLLHKKAIFSILTDPQHTGALPAAIQQALATHVPWTRRVRPGRTDHRGASADLVELVRSRREEFVLKPNDEYGGKGVVLGFACSQAEWDEAIARALEESYVVQELVRINREPFLQLVDGDWKLLDNVVDLDPYLNGPLLGGCLTRISTTNLANVTAGGGTLPMFILRD